MDYTYISNEGVTLCLYRYGAKLQFSSPASCTAFLQSIKGGRAAMVDVIVKKNIFVDVVLTNVDAAAAIIDDYFAKQSAFYMIGTLDDFVAREHNAVTLEESFPALFDYITAVLNFGTLETTLELTSTDPGYTQRISKLFEHLHSISQDPIKRHEWLTEHAAVRAKRESSHPLPIPTTPNGNPMWSMTTFNSTGKQKLTFDGPLPYSLVDDYTIVQQPSPSFTMGAQTISWYCDVPWFAYGPMSLGMKWKTITGRIFGVAITVPLVAFGIGSDPYYEVWFDATGHWEVPPGGPSAPYQFPEGWGYTVQISPTCGGKELFVQMHVEKETSAGLEEGGPNA